MSQNGQTHFKKLAANAASVFDHFETLCIKGLKKYVSKNKYVFLFNKEKQCFA